MGHEDRLLLFRPELRRPQHQRGHTERHRMDKGLAPTPPRAEGTPIEIEREDGRTGSMSAKKNNPLVGLAAHAVCFTVGMALAIYGGAFGIVGIVLAGAPIVLFFQAL